jgi:putative ABC transport system permease protein
MGVRVALGAQRADILRAVFSRGLIVVAAGIAVGLLAAFAIGHLVSSFLVDVSATDALIYSVISAALSMVALLACYVPARRIARIDPVEALRSE